MKGYAYMDLDGNIIYKLKDYIENDNPLFWSENRHLIVKKWSFDTEDFYSMERLYRDLSDLQVNASRVLEFSSSINFNKEDAQRLKQNVGKI